MASESPWAASEVKNHCNLSSLVPLPPLSLSNRMPSIKEAVNSTCTPSQSASMRINLQGQWRWFQHKAVPEKDAACCQPSCLSPHLILELANQFVFENRNGTQHGLQFTSHCQPETVYATNALHEIAIWLHTNSIKHSKLLQPSIKQQNQCNSPLTSCPDNTVSPATSNAHVLCFQSNE
jgi:hypothetical protein